MIFLVSISLALASFPAVKGVDDQISLQAVSTFNLTSTQAFYMMATTMFAIGVFLLMLIWERSNSISPETIWP